MQIRMDEQTAERWLERLCLLSIISSLMIVDLLYRWSGGALLLLFKPAVGLHGAPVTGVALNWSDLVLIQLEHVRTLNGFESKESGGIECAV